MFEDGGADGDYGARSPRRSWMNAVRIEQTPRRVPPPHESLDTGDATRSDLDDGLVVKLELLRTISERREIGS